jgi:hypothetical protein
VGDGSLKLSFSITHNFLVEGFSAEGEHCRGMGMFEPYSHSVDSTK